MKYLSLLSIIFFYILLNNTIHAVTFESEPPGNYPQCLKELSHDFESLLSYASQYGANFDRDIINKNLPCWNANKIKDEKDLELKILIENFLINRKECIKNYIPKLYSVCEFNAGNNVIRLLNVMNDKFFVTKNLDNVKRKITSKAIFYLRSNKEFPSNAKSTETVKSVQHTESTSNTKNVIEAIYKLEEEIAKIKQQKNFNISFLVIALSLLILFVIVAVYVWKLYGLFHVNQKQIAENALKTIDIENQFNKNINNLSNEIQKITTQVKQISISKKYSHNPIKQYKQNKLSDEEKKSKILSEYNQNYYQDEESKFIKEWHPSFYKRSNEDKKYPTFIKVNELGEADYWLINCNEEKIIVPSYRSIKLLRERARSTMSSSFDLFVKEMYNIIEGYEFKIKKFAIINNKGEVTIESISQKGELVIPTKDKKTTKEN